MEHRPLTISRASTVRTNIFQQVEQTWPEFVRSCHELKKVIPVDHAAYAELPKDEQRKLKDGHVHLLGALQDGIRKKESIISREGLTYDLDGINQEQCRTVYQTLEASGYNYLLYSSASYDGINPRIRIEIPLSHAIAPADYETLARNATELFKIPEDDECSYEDTHLMYYPAQLKDVKPIFEARTDGLYLDPADVPAKALRSPQNAQEQSIEPYGIKHEISDSEAIEAVRQYAAREQTNLAEYPHYISAQLVICRAVQLEEISMFAGTECTKLLAGNKVEWIDSNLKKFERELKNPRINTTYAFRTKFMNNWSKATDQTRSETSTGIKTVPRRFDTAYDLYDEDLPPIEFYVDQIVPVGIGWLAGESKVGKSFLAMQMAMNISAGEPFLQSSSGISFDGYRTQEVPVLYYSLEMAPNVLQDRLHNMRPSGSVSNRLFFAYDLPRFDQGGYEVLESDIKSLEAKVIFIDVHGKVSAKKSSQNPLYEQTYDEMDPLRRIAEENNCSIILLTHLNKSIDSSLYNRMMGSTANRGASDFNMVMAKDGNGQTMFMEESRKSEGVELLMKWNKEPLGFEYVSSVGDMLSTRKQEEYLSNPLVNAIKTALKAQSRVTLTSTDLRELMPEWIRDNWTPQRIGKQMKSIEANLRLYDQISIDSRRDKNQRCFTISKPKESKPLPGTGEFLVEMKKQDRFNMSSQQVQKGVENHIPIND